MKFFLFLILPFSFSLATYSQVVSVSNMSNNTVTLDKTNRLQIVVENSPCNSISVTTDNGRIRKVEPCVYDFTPSRSGLAQLVVHSTARSKPYNYLLKVEGVATTTASNKDIYYRVGDESINAYVSKYNGGRIRKADLSVQIGIYAKQANSKTIDYVIERFSYMIIRDGKQIANNLNNTATFSNALKRDIDNMRNGDRLLFYNINAIDNNSRPIYVKPIEFYII